MPDLIQNIGKLLITVGIVLAAIGAILLIFRHLGIPLGRLPGDIIIQKKNFSFYFPVVTSILLSILLSLIFYFIFRK